MRDIRVFKTLLGHKNLDFSIECLKSFISNPFHEIHIHIFEDGSITNLDKQKLLLELKNSVIISKKERDIRVQEILAEYPNCYQYRNNTNYAQKLFDVMIYDNEDLFFIDSDIFFLKKFKLPQFNGVPAFMKDVEHAYSFNPITFLKIQTPIYPCINSGFFYFPKASFDLNFIEALLANDNINQSFKSCISWSEQTIWAFLAAKNKAVNYFDNTQIIMAEENLKSDYNTVAIHLVSTYRKHFEEVKKKAFYKESMAFEEVGLVKGTRYLNKFEFAVNRIIKKAKRHLQF